jgi:hypothetical protein
MKNLLNILIAVSSIFLGSILVFAYGPESLVTENPAVKEAPAKRAKAPAKEKLKTPTAKKPKAKAKKIQTPYQPKRRSKVRTKRSGISPRGSGYHKPAAKKKTRFVKAPKRRSRPKFRSKPRARPKPRRIARKSGGRRRGGARPRRRRGGG